MVLPRARRAGVRVMMGGGVVVARAVTGDAASKASWYSAAAREAGRGARVVTGNAAAREAGLGARVVRGWHGAKQWCGGAGLVQVVGSSDILLYYI